MNRRPNGEGSIIELPSGKYMGRYTHNGKRPTVYGDSFEEVSRKITLAKASIERGDYIDPNSLTVEKWLTDWLKQYVLPNVKQSTYVSYSNYVNVHVIPEIGKIKLTALAPEQLQIFFNTKKKGGRKDGKSGGLSMKTLRNMYNMLHAALDQAILSRKLNFNPIKAVKLGEYIPPEMRVLTSEEQLILFKGAHTYPEISSFAVDFALMTGLRIGEMLALRWSDFNMNDRSFKVKRTITRLRKTELSVSDDDNLTEIVIDGPKTLNSRRTVPIVPSLWDGLLRYRDRQKEYIESTNGAYNNQGYVIANSFGDPYEPRTYSDIYKRILQSCGFDEKSKITFHTLRHTFATRALEAGMDIKALSVILGHGDTSTTLNKYAHVLADHKKESMNKINGLYDF
jgi:integrase